MSSLKPQVTLQIVASLTDNFRGFTYDRNMFLVQTTGVTEMNFFVGGNGSRSKYTKSLGLTNLKSGLYDSKPTRVEYLTLTYSLCLLTNIRRLGKNYKTPD